MDQGKAGDRNEIRGTAWALYCVSGYGDKRWKSLLQVVVSVGTFYERFLLQVMEWRPGQRSMVK